MSVVSAHPESSRAAAPSRAARWIAAIAAFAVAIVGSIVFLDRPLAALAYGHLRPFRKTFDALTHLIDPLPTLALLVLAWAAISSLRGRALGPTLEKLTRTAAALCVTIVAKDQLKFAFGRTWPETWTNNNPSFFGNGTYGFFPFHGGQGWASFPSGHTAIVCAVAASCWLLWPRGRVVYALAVAIVIVGLMGADYHWISDVIAGGALGTAIGLAGARIGRRA